MLFCDSRLLLSSEENIFLCDLIVGVTEFRSPPGEPGTRSPYFTYNRVRVMWDLDFLLK